MAAKSALLIGATGQTGRVLLQELLSSPDFHRVGEYGRRVTPLEKVTAGKAKLEQKIINFEKLGESGLKDGKWDVIFITLGTTRASAGSAAAFEKIDREYVINAARAAKSGSPEHSQRLVYLSAAGADSKSSFLYPRSKGLTEEALASLGYNDTIVFRPAFLKGARREESRIGETVAGFFTTMLSHITPNVEIQIPDLAKSMMFAGKLGTSALPASAKAYKAGNEGSQYTIIPNSGATALARASS